MITFWRIIVNIRNVVFILLIGAILFFTVSNVFASENITDNIVISNSNHNTYTDLNDKISDCDNIIILDKNYTFDSNYDEEFKNGISIKKELTIDGQGYSINGNNLAGVFKIESDNVILKNINFINLNSVSSGSIVWNGDNGFVQNCNFTNNSCSLNGIIEWRGGNGSVGSCMFKNNSVIDLGSTVFWIGDCGTVTNTDFIHNGHVSKGTLFWRGSNGNIQNCSFIGNGDYNYSLNKAKIVLDYEWDCRSVNPYSNPLIRSLYFFYGGAVYCDGNNLLINNSKFLKNSAFDGGAIYCAGKNLRCINSTFTNNTCVNDGGAIYCSENAVNSSIIDLILINNTENNGLQIFTQNSSENEFTTYKNILMINNNSVKWFSNKMKEYYSLTDLLINNHIPNYLLEKLFESDEKGSFDELSILINNTMENGILFLNKDYEFISGSNKGCLISKSIVIDGQGHTLNGNHLSRMFNVTADNVTIRNINFVNGNAFGRYFTKYVGGGAVYWSGSNGILQNCNFTNNTGSGIEDDPFDKEETVLTENGTVIHIIRMRPMGAKINEGGAVVWNGTNGLISKCIFNNNHVGYPNCGGAICWRGDNGKVIGSEFYRNGAWCGSAICWMGNNGAVLSSVICNSSFFDGGIYWFGTNGTIKNSILIKSSYTACLRSSEDINADYNFWGDTLDNPNFIGKIDNISNWLVIKFSHNGEFVKKGDKLVIKYDLTTLYDKNGKISTYNELINYSSQIYYTADKTGFLKITFKEGKINIDVDSRDEIVSKDLTGYYAGPTSFSVSVYDVSGKVVGKLVKFTINNKNYYVKTNKNGVATLKINLKPGKYVVYSSYGKVKVKNKLTVKSTLITKNISKKVKKSGKFNVKVLNSKGKAFSKQSVKIKFKGKLYNIKTNRYGIASLKLSKNLKVGKYLIKTYCNGLVNSNWIIVKK